MQVVYSAISQVHMQELAMYDIYWHEIDSEQVPWGKDKKHFEKRVKQYVKQLGGKQTRLVQWLCILCDTQICLEDNINAGYNGLERLFT